MTRWLNDTEMLAWRRLLHGSTRLLEQLDRELRDQHQLTLPDYEILSTLSEVPGRRLRMSDLADRALLSASGLTYRVGRLEERGLIERVTCADDGRAVEATLTETGMRLVEDAAPTHVAGVRDHFIDRVDRKTLERVSDGLSAILADLGRELP